MRVYRLSCDNMIDPRWFNNVRYGQFDCIVDKNGTIELKGEKLAFTNTDEALPAGTVIKVWLNRFFECATLEDIKERDADLEKKRIQEANDLKDYQNNIRKEAERFNATINLPCKWDVGIKDVLSGLSQNSRGDGRNRATVNHIVVLENLEINRLKRSKNSFLCSTNNSSAMTGKQWSGQMIERFVDGDGNEYMPKVTCKNCLRVLERINKQRER